MDWSLYLTQTNAPSPTAKNIKICHENHATKKSEENGAKEEKK